ncbi:beta-galactosidase/beta-glucuronidase [Anaerotaenia torta]|uniref:glycoside hydrolase family 2 protein n=1 Tax=Anaerotaenia torta TaxID=433293 RepID=UPI003D1FFDBB
MLRTEYPRPQFVRKEWQCLNGTWDFDFDDLDQARSCHWEKLSHPLSRKIEVPFCFESKLSGIQDTSVHNRCFYRRTFTLPAKWQDRNILLHFGGVDYRCRVYIDEALCGEHEGGSSSFAFDITHCLDSSLTEHSIAVYVEDPAADETIPRGKQFWEEKSAGIWYTRTSGIWQTVWLEPVDPIHITRIKMTSDFDQDILNLECTFSGLLPGMTLETVITFGEEIISNDCYSVSSSTVFKRSIHLAGDKIFHTNTHGANRSWTPENPALYDIRFVLKQNGRELDRAESYFGMRKIHTENGMVYLNNHPYYQKLVLDQGYWPEGILTAPSDEAFQYDITIMKEMGFNGCRKHQKTEDPRFLYWADRLGYLVWEELPAACLFTDSAVMRYMKEWMEIIERDYNHPSIITWVPFNESWAVPDIGRNALQQDYTVSVYHMLKALDPSRLVINNDGWELTKTDICAIHNYSHGTEKEPGKQKLFQRFTRELPVMLSPCSAGRSIFAPPYKYEGQPILITECGGIRYNNSEQNSWGYTSADSEEEFLKQYRFVIDNIMQSDYIYGFCYTQLSDVEQESNGLLTYHREPKCSPEKIREINSQYRHNVVIRD